MRTVLQGMLCILFILHTDFLWAQNVWTQHNDQARTGWYPFEDSLNINNVNSNTFGLNYSHVVDDRIYAQPLVMTNLNIPGHGIKNVVFVATVNGTIYAFDADINDDPFWKKNYIAKTAPDPAPNCNNCSPASNNYMHPSLCGTYGDIMGNMGIIGTPVIDTATGTMYFVTKIINFNEAVDQTPVGPKPEYHYSSTGFHQYLHAIDILTGNDLPNSPVEIKPVSTGTGDGQTSPGVITFDPRRQFNRTGLALSGGKVYICFAAHCDFNPSHGTVVSYDASTLVQQHVYNATPNDGRGGIWMSGTAPAIDENGNIYFTTGNSLNEDKLDPIINTYTTSPSDPANRGESVVKLNPDLTLSSYFTPFTYLSLNDADKDFSTQVMLLPNTNLAMAGCKDDTLYIMDRNDLGGFDDHRNNVRQTVSVQAAATMHSNFAYFGGPTPYAYQFSENSQLKSYPVTASGLGPAKINTAIVGPSGAMGGFLSTSSLGFDPSTGILWAYNAQNGCNANNSECGGVFHAVNASDVTKELWNSDMNATDNISVFNKMCPPTIALGKVYLAANRNQLCVYGLKTNTTCVTNVALNKPATALTSLGGVAANATDGDMTTAWRSQPQDVDSIYIDLGSRYDVCKMVINWETSRFGKDFDLKVSSDGVYWTILTSVRKNVSTYTEFDGSFTGRYVSMVGIHRGLDSGYSILEFQVFGSPASSCRPPRGLAATTLSPSSVRLSWDPIADASQYIVEYHSNLSVSWLTRTATADSLDLTAISCGPVYYYTVQAICGSGRSAVSDGSFSINDCPPTTCDILPTRYFNVDLGDIGVAGSTCKNGNIWTIAGSGAGIAGGDDAFQFAYTSNDIDDDEVSGRILTQDAANAGNNIGVMIRDSLTNSSRFAFLASVDNGYNLVFKYRDQPSGMVTSIPIPGHYELPYWVKLSKIGTQYEASISPDGIAWTPVTGPIELNFGNDIRNAPHYGMAVTSNNNNALSTSSIDNFSLLSSTELPIRLERFTAKKINDAQILVSWTTSMEHLVDYFQVEKMTNDSAFTAIGQVKAVGESESLHNYSFNDKKPFPGVNAYRLKEVDKDGNFFYSPVVHVKMDAATGFEMYPNPAVNYTNIMSYAGNIREVRLYDASGKLLQDLTPGAPTTQLNTSALARGIYFISVKTATGLYRQKLFKQ